MVVPITQQPYKGASQEFASAQTNLAAGLKRPLRGEGGGMEGGTKLERTRSKTFVAIRAQFLPPFRREHDVSV